MKTLALLIATGLLATGPTFASVTETVRRSIPLTADGIVHLENVNGDVEITAWDKPEVSLVAEKQARDDEELKRLEIEIKTSPDRVDITTLNPRKSGWSFFSNRNNNSSVRYRLIVPAGARLDKIGTVNADIKVTGVHGAVRLETVNGRVEAFGLRNDAQLRSVNGSLRADFASVAGCREVKLASVNGSAEVSLPKGASASIRTSTVNGGCQVDQPIKLSSSNRHHLTGQIGDGAGPEIRIETVNGGISVKEQ